MRAMTAFAMAMLFGGLTVVAQPPQQHQGHGQPPQGGSMGHMDHKFDDPERYAKSFDDPARDAWQMPDRVIQSLALAPGSLVADVGAGTGYFSMRLAKTAGKVFAVDIEPTMVEHVKKRVAAGKVTNVVGVLAGADRTNLPEPVDVVLIVDTYHHIPNRVAYFSDLKKLLKPGGRVAIVDFKKDSPEGPPPEFRFTADQITGEIGNAGYTLVKSHDFLPRQLFLIFQPK